MGKRYGGRQAGTPNKVTKTVKANVIAVFDMIGGLETMAEWATENRTDFFKLYSKLLPLQVDAEINHTTDRLSDSELIDIIISDSKDIENESQVIQH